MLLERHIKRNAASATLYTMTIEIINTPAAYGPQESTVFIDDVLGHFLEEGTSWTTSVSYLGAPERGVITCEVLLNVTSRFERCILIM
ncbi:hypothetical protein Hdeb2414_s0005g00178571 [Helianthus debilis subsp. tardiflorus]